MIEFPAQAFKKIIIAEHKNFVLFLALFLGIASVFALLWVNQSGHAFDNLLTLLLYGLTIGVVSALPLLYLLAGTIFSVSKLFNGKGTFTETYGVVGWSLVPVMLFVVFVLPLELGTLGLLLFSGNPSALDVKPTVTMVLLGLQGLLFLWSIVLSALGISMVHRFRFLASLLIALLAITGVSGISYFIFLSFNI